MFSFFKACEYSLQKELMEYEVEYHVLQEELSITPQHEADLKKLKEANKNLHRQNLELVEQLHNKSGQQHALEATNQVDMICYNFRLVENVLTLCQSVCR